MKISYCGPISLKIVEDAFGIPLGGLRGYEYPLGAYLCKEYSKMGHELQIVTCSTEITSPKVFVGKGVAVNVVPRRRPARFLLDAYRTERRQMEQALIGYRPDIVHAQWCYEFAHAARDSKFPTLVTIRDVPLQILKQLRTLYRVYRFFYGRWVISRGGNFSCISTYVEDELRNWFPRRARVTVIPNGLDGAYFSAKTDHAVEARKFLCIAGADQRKNFDLVFEAFVAALRERKELILQVCGSGLDSQCLWAKRAADLGCARNFVWLGACPHKRLLDEVLPNSDVFITATKEESFCMVVLEAMAKGVPVIAFRGIGAIPWLLNDGECGVLITSSMPEDWGDELVRLSSDRGRRMRLSSAAYRRANQFRLDQVASRYVQEFQTILGI